MIIFENSGAMNKIVFILLLFVLLISQGFAQSEISRFLSSGAKDVEKLTELYLNPFGKGFGTAMNSGWYTTAKPHELFGFDLTVNSTFVSVPAQDANFNLDLTTWNTLLIGEQEESPTIAGAGDAAYVGLEFENGGKIENVYQLPTGINFKTVPLPMMQLGLGLMKGTDFTFRYFPEMNFADYGKIGMFGFGLKHDFKQWIPGFNKLPFDMSLQGAWSRLSGTYNKVEYYPTKITNIEFEVLGDGLPVNDDQIENDYYRTQDLTLTTSAWNVNLILSKEISVLTGFVSLGYAESNFNVALNGKYLLPDYRLPTDEDYDINDDENGDQIITVLDAGNDDNIINDPLDVNIPYSSVNAAVGLRLKLGLFTMHAAYVYQDYSMLNAGLGVSFR